MDASAFAAAANREREIRVEDPVDLKKVPIWIVTVDDAVYIRSYRARAGRWYQHVSGARQFEIEIGGEIVPVRPEAVSDPDELAAVDESYSTKYAGEAETAEMVTPDVAATTTRLMLAEEAPSG